VRRGAAWVATQVGALGATLLIVALALWLAPRPAVGEGPWAGIEARGFLVVGVPLWLPPFGAPGQDGGWQGLDVVLAHALAQQALGSPARVHLLPLPPGDRLWALQHGVVDAVAAAFAGPATGAAAPAGVERVGPYFQEPLVLLVRRGRGVGGPRALDGEAVGVLPGGRAATALQDAMAPWRAAVREVADLPAAAAELTRGRLRGVVLGQSVAAALAARDPELMVQPFPRLGQEAYWLLVPADAPRLVEAAQRAIASLPRGEALRAGLRRWAQDAASLWPDAP
jgi:ABC-type amino acid transport substrate-binding protein